MTADERIQAAALFLRMSLMWQRMHEFERDAGGLGLPTAARKDVVGSPGYRTWFARRKDWLTEDFRAQVEMDIAASEGLSLDWASAPSASVAPGGE